MPTGYTAIIDHNDATFEQYVWRCARAFGALVMMRDDPLDTDPPEKFEPSDYYEKRLKEARAKVAELADVTTEQAAALAESEYAAAFGHWEERRAEEAELDRRYAAMKKKVMAWKSPSPDHDRMKEFMLSQLVEGRRWSGAGDPPRRMELDEWLATAREKASRDVVYFEEEARKEAERIDSRNRWLSQLRESVPYVKQPKVSP